MNEKMKGIMLYLSSVESSPDSGNPGVSEGSTTNRSPWSGFNLTQNQTDRLRRADELLERNLIQHEDKRELMQLDGRTWLARTKPYDQYTEVLKLGRDVRTYMAAVLSVLGEAIGAAVSPEEFRRRFEEGATTLLASTLDRVAPIDMAFVDRAALETTAANVRYAAEHAASNYRATSRMSHLQNSTVFTFTYGDFPKIKYHWTKKEMKVANVEEEKNLGGGWGETPNDFAPYRGPRIAPPDPHQVAKWLDEWSIPGLTDGHRKLIKIRLLQAHAMFWRSPEEGSPEIEAMRLAYQEIGKVLFEAQLLTEAIMKYELPTLVWDSAIAGGWHRWASETPKSIFPERIGHYFVWRDEAKDWGGLFTAEMAQLMAKLLDQPIQHPTRRSTPKVAAKNPQKLSSNQSRIDSTLRAIAEARPKNHEEVFMNLDSRKIPCPAAEPFKSAGGWISGFKKDPNRARSWLSKRWTSLGLPTFRRGPK